MAQDNTLVPAIDLAGKNKAHFPDEPTEYRQALNARLAEEIELRRHIERVAALRRELPSEGQSPRIMSSRAERRGSHFATVW